MNGFFNVAMPFSGLERMKMHGVVILAIFGFCLVLAHAVAARRPLVAVLAVVAGAGWAATLYPSRSVVFGAVILAGALWALAGLRSAQPVTAAPRRGGAHSRGGGGVDLACGREGRRPRVGALESEWLVRRGDLRQLCLGRAVRRHPVLEEGTDCPADYGSEARALLAGDDARPVRLGSLARQPDSALDRPRKREAAQRPAPADALAGPEHLGEAGGGDRRAPRPAHHRRRAAGRARGASTRRRLPPLGRARARLQRPRARGAIHRLQLRAAPRAGRPGAVSTRSTRRGSNGSSTSAARASSRSAYGRSGCAGARRSSTTSATWRCGRTRSSGTRPSGCAQARGRRTEPSSRSRRGCAAPAASPTTSRRPPPAACRRSPTSSPRARAATASTSPARWR